MAYYICKYSDYVGLPSVLYTGHTTGFERKSLDGTKFIISTNGTPGIGVLDWMLGSETSFTHSEIKTERINPEWAPIDAPYKGDSLYHVMTLGASNSGGYNADPSLTTVSMSGVHTLTDGPLAPDVSGSSVLIPLVEGDTYNQDAVPQTHTNIESQASGIGHQLKSLLNSDAKEVCVTVHYRGGTSIQKLSNGGTQSAVGYTQLVAASNRVKAISDANGQNYIPILFLYASGSGANPYETGLTDAIADVRAGIAANYTGEVQVVINQPRIVGSPEFGPQVYDLAKNVSGVHVSQPMNDATDPTEIQGDNIHWTNHGQRHTGVYNAFAIYDVLKTGSAFPLDLDTANLTFNSVSDKIIVPVLGATGVIQTSGDLGLDVTDTDRTLTIGGTWAVNGSDLEFTITSNKPSGSTNIEISTGAASGTIKDSRLNTNVIFNNASAAKYPVENYMARNDHALSVDFPIDFKINLGGEGTTPTMPDGWFNVSPWSISGDQSANIVFNIDDQTGITLTLTNDGTSGASWGFDSLNGNIAGDLGFVTGSDSGIVPDQVLQSNFFLESATASAIIGGLDSGKTYTLKIGASRDATGSRITDYTIGATTKSLECVDNSANEVTFNAVSAPSGNITIEVTNTNHQFGYLGWVEITEE